MKTHIILTVAFLLNISLQAQKPLSAEIKINPDDKPAYEAPPAGFNAPADDVDQGKLEMVEYESKTVGTTRKMQVYTPPKYQKNKEYPVLYLLHGIGGDESEWQRLARVDALMNRLISERKAKPMIVVMPNGRAQKNDRAEGNVFASAPAFATFEKDLLEDVIPAVEKKYKVKKGSENRALAGLSMGGGQTLNFGLAHLATFAWLGAFSAAPNTKSPQELIPEPEKSKKQLKYFLITCGNKDGLLYVSQKMHLFLTEQKIPHTWHVDGCGHDGTHWSHALYYFSQQIFR